MKCAVQQVWQPLLRRCGVRHRNPNGMQRWIGTIRYQAIALVTRLALLLATFAHAQPSEFLFDANGNLLARATASIAPPQIIGQPQNQTVPPGGTASFSVVAADTRQLSYQWQFRRAIIGSGLNDSILREDVNANDEGEYRVVLTNPSGSVTSAPAFLMLDSDADGLGDSWEAGYFTNLNATATADIDGDGVSNFQEFLDGTDPTNSASARYRLLVLRDGGSVLRSLDQVSYTNGESVTLTAFAAPGQEPFHAWLGEIVTRSNPVTVVMTTNRTIYARFTPIDFVWTTGAGDWNSATNWTPNLVPATNDNASITINTTVSLNGSEGCRDLLLGDAASNPVLTGSGLLTVHKNFLWRSGTMSGLGKTLISAGATLAVTNANGVSLIDRTLENNGTVNWIGIGDITLFPGAVITNRPGALFDVQNAATLSASGSGIRFDNAGTFRRSLHAGTATLGSGMSFNNSGTVEIQSGTLLCSGGFTNHGAVNLSPGTTHRLGGGGSNGGIFNASATALVEWAAGTFTLDAATELNGAGVYRINFATVTADSAIAVENLDLMNGTLTGAGTVTINTLMNWSGGTWSGNGRTFISAGATLNLAPASAVSLNTRILENDGTVHWTGAGSMVLNFGAVITNRAGALFDFQNASSLQANLGVSRFDNAGTFRKSSGTGATIFGSGMILNNSGLVEIQIGTLALAGHGTNSGTFATFATGLVEWTGGSFTLNPGAQLNGDGLYRINAGTVTANANLAIEKLDLITGTLGGPGAVTINSLMNWSGGTMSGGGRTIIPAGAMLNANLLSGAGLNARTLDNAGTILWTGAGNIGFVNAVITNRAGALFHAQSGGGLTFVSGPNRFDNAGTFRKSVNAGTLDILDFSGSSSFNNFGTVEIQTGTLLCNASFTNAGVVQLSSATTNRIAKGGSATGTFETPTKALMEWTGRSFTLNPGAQLNGPGLYRINGIGANVVGNGDVTVQNFDLVNGSSTLSGTGALTIANVMNWTAGTMDGTGRTVISPAATLSLANPNFIGLQRTLENAGTVAWTSSGTIGLLNGVITNRAGAVFQALNASRLAFSGGACRFDNSGTFRKFGETGTMAIDAGVPFNNTGTVDIRSGILAANGGYVSTATALLNCSLGGTTPGTNYGQLRVGGAVTLNGGLSVEFIDGFLPTTNDSFTVLTAGTRNGAFANFSYPSNVVTMQLSNTPNSVIARVSGLAVPELVLFAPMITGSNVTLCWVMESNKTYLLEFNPDLGPTNWVAVSGEFITSGNTACISDALTTTNRFYRVRVLP
jgi:hypothetical protein